MNDLPVFAHGQSRRPHRPARRSTVGRSPRRSHPHGKRSDARNPAGWLPPGRSRRRSRSWPNAARACPPRRERNRLDNGQPRTSQTNHTQQTAFSESWHYHLPTESVFARFLAIRGPVFLRFVGAETSPTYSRYSSGVFRHHVGKCAQLTRKIFSPDNHVADDCDRRVGR
jgi:hypothetical protein